MNNYRIISEVGSGAYSTVQKAIDVQSGQIVAIKRIAEHQMNLKHIIGREVNFLHECSAHPNIIKLYKCFSQGGYTYLVFEYMPMDLISFYKSVFEQKKRHLTEDEISFIAFQLLGALQHLHSRGIMHRDIKPENVLIDPETLQIKLIDFGFAKKIDSMQVNTNYMITRWYRPLEIVLGVRYSEKVDVFSAGALLLELYLGKEVFRSASNIDQFHWITRICGFPFDWKEAREAVHRLGLQMSSSTSNSVHCPQLKELYSGVRPLARDLIAKMLASNPSQRISIQEAVKHPYFSRYRISSSKPSLVSEEYNLNNPSIRSANLLPPAMKKRAISTQNDQKVRIEEPPSSIQRSLNRSKGKSGSKWNLISLKSIKNKQTDRDEVSSKKSTKMQQSSKKPPIHRIQPSQSQRSNRSREKELSRNMTRVNTQQSNIRQRVKSLNQGIHVVSLKKLKVNRQVDQEMPSKVKYEAYQPSKVEAQGQPMRQKYSPARNNGLLKQNKEKPMFLKIRQKINEGHSNQMGDKGKQFVPYGQLTSARTQESYQTLASHQRRASDQRYFQLQTSGQREVSPMEKLNRLKTKNSHY